MAMIGEGDRPGLGNDHGRLAAHEPSFPRRRRADRAARPGQDVLT
jgi:hypothetical protein